MMPVSQDPVGSVIVRSVRHPRRRPLPETLLYDYPFFRVTPSGLQVGMGRDLVVALGSPSHIIWQTFLGNNKRVERVRVTASQPQDSAFALSYVRGRPSAITTLPVALRKILVPGRYYALSLPEKGLWPKYVDFPVVPGVRAVPVLPAPVQSQSERGGQE